MSPALPSGPKGTIIPAENHWPGAYQHMGHRACLTEPQDMPCTPSVRRTNPLEMQVSASFSQMHSKTAAGIH